MNRGDEFLKDYACMMAEVAMMRERLRQVHLSESDWLPWWASLWGYLGKCWRAAHTEWLALRAIREVAVVDASWAASSREKFLKELDRPVGRLPDGSYVIGRNVTVKTDRSKT